MIACVRTKEWDNVTKHLRQDVFANQCLIESLEMNSPPVPHDVWIAQKSPDQIVGVMVVEEMPHLPCVAIRVTLSEAIPVLFHSLEPGKKYLFTIGADFRDQLLAGVSEPTDQLEIVSLVLSTDEDFRPFKGVGEVRQLRLTDKSLTDEFPSPSSGEPPLSRFVEWAEGQRVFGLLTEETIVSFVQFGHLLDELWEVGMIRTREEHKGKGFAKAVLSEASSQLLQEGKIPFYQVRLSNVASLRTAKAVGYREVFRLFSCSGQIAAN